MAPLRVVHSLLVCSAHDKNHPAARRSLGSSIHSRGNTLEMYGMNSTLSASGAVLTSSGLALTGLNIAAAMLTVFGVILICTALFGLLRPNCKARP